MTDNDLFHVFAFRLSGFLRQKNPQTIIFAVKIKNLLRTQKTNPKENFKNHLILF